MKPPPLPCIHAREAPARRALSWAQKNPFSPGAAAGLPESGSIPIPQALGAGQVPVAGWQMALAEPGCFDTWTHGVGPWGMPKPKTSFSIG